MKAILYASLSANGQVLLAEDINHQIPQEILLDFMGLARKTGNVIMGRKTFDLMAKDPGAKQAFQGIEIIIISGHKIEDSGYTVVSSPAEALDHLKQKNYTEALVAGGTQIYRSFLREDLIDELILNTNPIITANGADLTPQNNLTIKLELADTKRLAKEVVQLHYSVRK